VDDLQVTCPTADAVTQAGEPDIKYFSSRVAMSFFLKLAFAFNDFSYLRAASWELNKT
jgi:hypothetical protein